MLLITVRQRSDICIRKVCVRACLLHTEDTQNLKALYRRGQAYAALHEYQEAEQDLTAAAAFSGSDPQQLQLIKEKLAAVREQLAAKPPAPAKQQQQQAPQPPTQPEPQPAAQQEEQRPQQQEQGRQPQQAADSTADSRSRHQQEKQAPTKAAAASMEEEDGLIEEIMDDRVPRGSSRQQQAQVVMDFGDAGAAPAARSSSSQAKRAAAAAASSGRSAATAPPPAGGLGDMSAQMQQMAEMMRSNPGMMRQVRQGQERVAAAWGLVRVGGCWFAHTRVCCVCLLCPAAFPAAAPTVHLPPFLPAACCHRLPAALWACCYQAAEMMRSMPAEQLAEMSRMSGAPAMDPEALAQMQRSMAGLSPNQLESMMRMSASMGPAAAGGGMPQDSEAMAKVSLAGVLRCRRCAGTVLRSGTLAWSVCMFSSAVVCGQQVCCRCANRCAAGTCLAVVSAACCLHR